VGVAAHITAASPGGARYNADLTPEERVAAENGIWMCGTHGTMVDRDDKRYTVAKLRQWKQEAEAEADEAIGKTLWPEDRQQSAEPDVSVIFSWEKYAGETGKAVPADGFSAPPFEIKNFGTAQASEVQVQQFAGGALVAQFPLIADLGPDESTTRKPNVIDPSARAGPVFSLLNPMDIEDLLEAADAEREHRRLKEVAKAEPLAPHEIDAIVDELGERFHIAFRVTYWNREHTRQWEKLERLCYEPNDHRAYVLHGERRELYTPS